MPVLPHSSCYVVSVFQGLAPLEDRHMGWHKELGLVKDRARNRAGAGKAAQWPGGGRLMDSPIGSTPCNRHERRRFSSCAAL